MSILTCRDTRRVLNAYHDGELTMDQQVAVQSHLRGCAGCRAERRRLRDIGTLLRAGASRVRQEPGRLERHVLARLYVERQLSWRGRLNRLFEDLHLVWAAAGATAATIAVVCSAVGMMQLTFQEQPASMAALIAERESGTFDIDNTPPTITVLSATRANERTAVRFVVRDFDSPVQRVEYALDANQWRPIYPKDGIADSRIEEFELDLQVDTVDKSIILRAVDAMNNVATGRAEPLDPQP